MSLIFRLQLATRCNSWQSRDVNKCGGRVRPPLRKLVADYEDLYLTEHPYGLVCGVETVLPAND